MSGFGTVSICATFCEAIIIEAVKLFDSPPFVVYYRHGSDVGAMRYGRNMECLSATASRGLNRGCPLSTDGPGTPPLLGSDEAVFESGGVASPSPEARPSFCWDRPWTAGDVRLRLSSCGGPKRRRLVAWILREASFPEVWEFLTPGEVYEDLGNLLPLLGRRRGFWNYILVKWHGMGKV